ncbi:MAG: primosomal protein N', partial [Nakamurella sp.]
MTAAPARYRPPRATAAVRVPAAVLPVARVLVDVSLAHLDRPYDYLVAEPDSAAAQPGVRVRVRFAGRLVNGFVLGRLAESEHPGRLGFLERVVSAEPVLTTEVAELAAAVAERYAGSVADVLRLAVPPRHAKVEAEPLPGAQLDGSAAPAAEVPTRQDPGNAVPTGALSTDAAVTAVGTDTAGPPAAALSDELPAGALPAAGAAAVAPPLLTIAPATDAASADPVTTGPTGSGEVPGSAPPPTGWRNYQAGPAFMTAIREHRPARAVWQALPGEDWPARLADAALEALGAGVGALLIVPDARDLARLDTALTTALGAGRHVSLAADLGPAERYRRFLAVSRGAVRVVAGTRAAVFAPVADLGLVAVFDDGDDLLSEPRAPYPHAREVLMLRSAARACALLVGGFARTAEAQLLVESGWARAIGAHRTAVRTAAPRIEAAGDDYSTGADSAAAKARLSPAAFAAAREALQAGAPVLVQVPRRGYVPVVACVRCRHRAQCRHCHGPLAL